MVHVHYFLTLEKMYVVTFIFSIFKQREKKITNAQHVCKYNSIKKLHRTTRKVSYIMHCVRL
jgi:hypothetical protein